MKAIGHPANFESMKRIFLALTLILLKFPDPGSAQVSSANELPYEVNRIYPYISVTKEKLKEAQTLSDLNKHYKPSWVKAYISVEVLTTNKGITKKAVSKNDTLTQKQKDHMLMADAATDISVVLKYLPDNNLKNNDIKTFDFTFTVDPENEATYPGGKQELNKYLKEQAIDKIPEGSFKGYDLTTVKFTINEAGEVVDAHIFWPTEKREIEAFLLETVRKMPCWQPATYADGTKVKQEFALMVGNMENCVVPLLNIRRE